MSAIPLLTDVVDEQVANVQIVGDQVVDKRKECREVTDGRALLHVVDARCPDLIGKAFHAMVINTSASGIRIASEHARDMMDGVSFEIWLGVDGRKQKLYLHGDTRWVSWEASGEFHLGIELFNDPNTDIDEWRIALGQ